MNADRIPPRVARPWRVAALLATTALALGASSAATDPGAARGETLAVAKEARDPGTLPQTGVVPGTRTHAFRARMRALWWGVTRDSLAAALPAFFPRTAYLRMKQGQIPDPAGDYRDRLLADYRLDLQAAHRLTGSGARLVGVSIPHQWAWIPPRACENGIGYWHAPGSRLVYRVGGRSRSFGIASFISWRGEWYVVHLAVNGQAGTVDAPAAGRGPYGAAGGC